MPAPVVSLLSAPPSAPPSTPQPGTRLGRFRLIAVLGRGAQAMVWRAHDERLDREVAVKLLLTHSAGLAQPLSQWLHEARAVSRLAHPHIVPVFDADQIDAQSFLVFELVPGQTLAQALRSSGAMAARPAVELMLGVVDALRAAHALGIVHRDLKPSNILLDADGRARVMDFGIAARLAGGSGEGLPALPAGSIVGTPGYLSPEAAAGAAASPQMDVFAAGLVLAELLAGTPLLVERDAMTALHRVQHEDLQLPAQADADDRLRAIVQRAIARAPADRYDSAASLRDALMQWLAPTDDSVPEPNTGQGTLDFLLRRMRHKSDFPALTQHVLRIQRLANSDTDNINLLADEILKDVALTQKLLRLVNTVAYRRNGHAVATVSRAVALVGLAGIRNMALSLVLVEHMKDKAHAQRLKEGFLRALLAGQLAHALAAGARDAEETFLGAMFYNLGSLLTEYYFPDEAEAIRSQLRLTAPASAPPGGPPLLPGPAADRAAEKASVLVLGLGFEALGLGVARHWGLPDALQRCMSRPGSAAPTQRLADGPGQQRWLVVAANEMADLLWSGDEAHLPAQMDGLVKRHGRALDLNLADLWRAAAQAQQALAQMAPAMGLSLPEGTRAEPLLAEPPAVLRRSGPRECPTEPLPPAAAPLPGAFAAASGRVADALAAGINDITDTLAGDSFQLGAVLRMVLETMYRALGLQRMVFCLRDGASGRLTGRFGLGDGAAALCPLFQVPLKWPAGQTPDLFGAVCLKARDTLISDSRQGAVLQRLPPWYRQHVDAPCILLLPMMMKGVPFALIYGDQAKAGGLQVGEREMALLRNLRNQAVMGFRQSSTPA